MELTRKARTAHRMLFAGVLAVVFAVGVAVPAFAATEVAYQVTEDGSSTVQTEAFSDEAAGISWDGSDTVTLNNASLYMVEISGDAVIQLVGESSASYIYGDGNLTIKGDKDAATDDKPVLNLVGDEVGGDAEIEAGSVTIEGATVNVDADDLYIGTDDDITVDNSKLATTNSDGSSITLDGATVTVSESEVDLGTGGGILAETLAIANSNVSVRYLDDWTKNIHGEEVVFTDMANGSTITDEEREYDYVTTDDEDGVFLKAAGTPGYYKDADDPADGSSDGSDTPAADSSTAGIGIPATGDENGALACICLVLALYAFAAFAIARRNIKE